MKSALQYIWVSGNMALMLPILEQKAKESQDQNELADILQEG
jgi:hypothetical protein